MSPRGVANDSTLCESISPAVATGDKDGSSTSDRGDTLRLPLGMRDRVKRTPDAKCLVASELQFRLNVDFICSVLFQEWSITTALPLDFEIGSVKQIGYLTLAR